MNFHKRSYVAFIVIETENKLRLNIQHEIVSFIFSILREVCVIQAISWQYAQYVHMLIRD